MFLLRVYCHDEYFVSLEYGYTVCKGCISTLIISNRYISVLTNCSLWYISISNGQIISFFVKLFIKPPCVAMPSIHTWKVTVYLCFFLLFYVNLLAQNCLLVNTTQRLVLYCYKRKIRGYPLQLLYFRHENILFSHRSLPELFPQFCQWAPFI